MLRRTLCATACGLVALSSRAEPVAAQSVSPDSVRPYLVFAPARESWFVAASRGKRMLLDIGRVDLEVRKDSAVAAAYRQAVTAASPVQVGTRFTLRAPWGAEEVEATAVDTWNGRIVLVLRGSAQMDSAAQGKAAVAASAERERPPAGGTRLNGSPRAVPAPVSPVAPPTRATAAGVAPCVRAPVEGIYRDRVKVVRDSLERALRLLPPPTYERLARRVTAHSSQVTGCFGDARVALAVSLRAGATEWARERVVLVDTLGHVKPLAVEDLRFKAHDLLHALDADGDGLDDVAAVGRAERAGGTTLLRYDAAKKRLVRLTAGFVWEDR